MIVLGKRTVQTTANLKLNRDSNGDVYVEDDDQL